MLLWAIYIYAAVSIIALAERGLSQLHSEIVKEYGKDNEFRIAIKYYFILAMIAFCIWLTMELCK